MNEFKDCNIIGSLGGGSGEVFLVESQGRKYVMRVFKESRNADFTYEINQLLKSRGIMPSIVHRDNNVFFIEYLEGRDCTKQDDLAFEVGVICGQINETKTDYSHDFEKEFFSNLKILEDKKIIDDNKFMKIREKYDTLREGLLPESRLDASDVYPRNFRVSKDKLYLVDIEAIRPRLRGRGISKAFSRWFKTSEQQTHFFQGYDMESDSSFWTDQYRNFCDLNFLINMLGVKTKRNFLIKEMDLRHLESLLVQ